MPVNTTTGLGSPCETPTVEWLANSIRGEWKSHLSENIFEAIKRGLVEKPKTTGALVDAVYVALEKISPNDATDLTLDILFRSCLSVHQDLKFSKGLALARLGLAHARNSDFWNCRFLHQEGICLSNLGKYEAALDSLTRAIEVSSRVGEHHRATAAWVTVAYTCSNAFQFPLAIAIYERVRNESQFDDLCMIATGNLATLVVAMGDAERGLLLSRSALEMASASVPVPVFNRSVTAAHMCSSVCALAALGRGAEALLIAREAQALASGEGAYVVEHARFSLGVALCASGHLLQGAAILKEMLEKNRADNKIPYVKRTLEELVRAYERNGQPEEALKYLREAFQLNKQALQAQMQLHQRFSEDPTGFNGDGALLLATQAVLEKDIRIRIQTLLETAVSAGLIVEYDENHIYRRSVVARLVAGALEWNEERTDGIVLAAQLADVGMIAIPDSILRKRSVLTADERRLVSEHSSYGAELIQNAKLSVLEMAANAARHHHERWDGSGNPGGLARHAIPIEARIIGLCDVFEALTHNRPWRKAQPVRDALSEIASLAGRWFDPELVKIFVTLVSEAFSNAPNWEEFLLRDGHSSMFVKTRRLLARSTQPETRSNSVNV